VDILVQQVHPGNANVVENDAAIVDARQTTLVLTVRRGHTGQVVAVGVADRHQDAMHTVVDLLTVFGGEELGEYRCDGGGFGGTADVVLARGGSFGVNDELLGVRVVGCGRLKGLHVAAVSGLGHRETAAQLEVD